jgi:3-deoxy-D-manno-octulosonate 8-phosphate phosphatase (KDO 8-P phosphatase)
MDRSQLLRGIRFLLLDVDGVLTDGNLHFDGEGRELKVFHVHDGSGLVYWHRTGHRSGFCSGRDSVAVRRRGEEMGVHEIHLGRRRKLEVYEEILGRQGLTDAEVCFVGDDLLDIPVLQRCGFPVTVPGGRSEVKAVCSLVTRSEAGRGAVRELIEHLLVAKGLCEGLVRDCGL